MSNRDRPLSPHLQVYRPQITSVLSITHRATGVALAAGALLLTYWLTSAAYGPEAFNETHAFFGTVIGRILLLGFTFAFFYHLCNGIRHLFWDAGKGYDIDTLRASGIAVVVAAVCLTLLGWSLAYIMRGG
jgi:succinate dehydrogenase / fumarate reductase cytochrome b subunit